MGRAIPVHRSSPPAPRAPAAGTRVYHTARWQRLRVQVLRSQPLCADPFGEHRQAGRLVCASHVDHVRPLAAAPERAYDTSNLQALCASCHTRKTRADERAAADSRTGVWG